MYSFSSCHIGTWALRRKCITKGAKNLLYEHLESKLVHRNFEYDLGSVLHLTIFNQNHVKISLNLNDLKKICKTRIQYVYMYFPYILVILRLEFFTDLMNCFSETFLFPDIIQKKIEICWAFFQKLKVIILVLLAGMTSLFF